MHLKTIKLAGFKSFMDPTVIPVKGSMNAVVGPNGCGKSNIVDAIRWVVGESSAKQLRGESMSDVIFNGTTARKPVSKASVELQFENDQGRLTGEYAAYSEISIRREVTRDGQSRYQINGTNCRRKDIIDLFLGTGMGSRSYSIIEQGMISRIIEAKPDEFRVYIEEAAGISKYKERRKETESRIKRTQENLERIHDISEELSKQLRQLKRQANAAERYKALKAEERELESQIKALQWQDYEKESVVLAQKINEKKNEQASLEAEYQHVETEIEKTRQSQVSGTDALNAAQKKYYTLGAEIARLEQALKDKRQQAERWKTELDETVALWEELTHSTNTYREEIETLTQQLRQLAPDTESYQQTLEDAESTFGGAEEAMQVVLSEWESFQAGRSEAARRAEGLKTHVHHNERRLATLQEKLDRLSHSKHGDQIDAITNEVAPLSSKVQAHEQSLEVAREDMDSMSLRITSQRQANREHNEALNTALKNLQTQQGRESSLSALQDAALKGDANSEQWLEAQGLHESPRLGASLKVEAGWELAVETVLGDAFDAVCVDFSSSHIHALHEASDANITLIQSSRATSEMSHGSQDTLASKIQCDWPLDASLNQIFITDTLENAMTLRDRLHDDQSVITPAGLWLSKHWVKVLKGRDANAGVLERERELASLRAAIIEDECLIESKRLALGQGEEALAELEARYKERQSEYQYISQTLRNLQSDLREKQTRLDGLKEQQIRQQQERSEISAEVVEVEDALFQTKSSLTEVTEFLAIQAEEADRLQALRDERKRDLEVARSAAQEAKRALDQFKVQMASSNKQLVLLEETYESRTRQLKQLEERRDGLTAQLEELGDPDQGLQETLHVALTQQLEHESSMNAAEEALTSINQSLSEFEDKKQNLHRAISQAKDELQSIMMDGQALLVRQKTVEEQLEANDQTVEVIIASLPQEANMTDWQSSLSSVSEKIRRLGAINLAAIEEFDAVSERKAYLDQQQADLEEALSVLQEAIKKIDKETRGQFKQTFEVINTHFQGLFPKIFGGGQASLALEEDDLLSTGILIKAQPPGKRNSTIHMLSGGEKALTAIALVFSFFQQNPAPFCILDEVDAPLDDVNVGRYCKLVKEMSAEIQFLVISHNKVTIEMADQLMGITMQEPGVSRVVSVDIEEAVSMVEA